MKMKQIQQGDVVLRRITKSKIKDAQKLKPGKRGLVLAEGEVTGHAHCIEETDHAELLKLGEQLLLSVEKSVELKHEEHGTIVVEPGLYEVDGIREKDWLSGMVRPVVD